VLITESANTSEDLPQTGTQGI